MFASLYLLSFRELVKLHLKMHCASLEFGFGLLASRGEGEKVHRLWFEVLSPMPAGYAQQPNLLA